MPQDNVIYVDTDEGAALFDGAAVKGQFWRLSRFFISENFLTYCGIASSAMVLNSLGIDAPDDPQIYPYTMFTQENLFTDAVLHRRRPLDVEKGGNTLEQLANVLDVFADIDIHFADTLDLDRCRAMLVEALKSDNERVIVDFDRRVLDQAGKGHFSPLAAYHADEDRFLLMDVARYKLPPCWVKASVLFEALTGTDTTSGKSRGFLTVRRRETPAGSAT